MTSRFRPLTPDHERRPEDEIVIDLERFETELAASIAKFDARHPDTGRLPPKDARLNEPLSRLPESTPLDLAPPATTTNAPLTAKSPAANAPAPAPISAGGLLGELRLAAEQKNAMDASAEAERKARIESTDQAMRRLFAYLGEFSGHMNRIQPPLPHRFRSPVPQIDLGQVRWLNSFLDYRTDGGTEISPLDSISFRYTLGSPQSVRIEKLPNHAQAYLEELKRFGFPHKMTERRGAKGLVAQVDFLVEPAITVSLLFKALPQAGVIAVRTRHLTDFPEFGYREFTLPVTAVDQTMLDELGKQILGRPNTLLHHLKPGAPDHAR